MGNNLTLFLLLLDSKVDVNAKDESGWTALIWATIYSRNEAVKLLLDTKADVNAKGKDGDTALWAYNSQISDLLKEEGAKK